MLLVGTVLGGSAAPLMAQSTDQAPPPPAATPTPAEHVIRSIVVHGNQRLEPETIRAYANLTPGQTYTATTLDQALKDLYATQLFADVTIGGADTGDLVITVRENPVINRIVLDGNKRLKDDKIVPEIKLAPRQIFTRSSASSSSIAGRAASQPALSRRSSSWTRTVSTSSTKSMKATSPRSARSTCWATANSPTRGCARKCTPARPVVRSAS